MDDQYAKLSAYYDAFVQKNRDYSAIARDLAKAIGENKKLLEIGIGTGLIAECLLKSNPDYKITGIDNSESLLQLASKKLGETVELVCQSVSELSLEKTFDVAYSRGGAWTLVSDGTDIFLASHLLDLSAIQQSFNCVTQHLKVGGQLIISMSNVYGDNLVELDNGVVHKRIANTEETNGERYAVMTYLFSKGQDILAQQELRLRLLNEEEFSNLLTLAGFVPQASEATDYRIYTKQ